MERTDGFDPQFFMQSSRPVAESESTPEPEKPEEVEEETPEEAPSESAEGDTGEPEGEPEEVVAEVEEYEAPTLGEREKILLEHFARQVEEAPEPESAPVEPPQRRSEPIVSDEVIENILNGDRASLAQALLEVYNAAVEAASTRSAELTLKSIPQTVSKHIRQAQVMQETVNDFYRRNDDLSNVKPIVTAMANRIAADHPEYTVQQLFSASATETRKLLGIQAKSRTPATNGATKPPSKPAFVGTKGGNNRVRSQDSEKKTLQDEVAALFIRE